MELNDIEPWIESGGKHPYKVMSLCVALPRKYRPSVFVTFDFLFNRDSSTEHKQYNRFAKIMEREWLHKATNTEFLPDELWELVIEYDSWSLGENVVRMMECEGVSDGEGVEDYDNNTWWSVLHGPYTLGWYVVDYRLRNTIPPPLKIPPSINLLIDQAVEVIRKVDREYDATVKSIQKQCSSKRKRAVESLCKNIEHCTDSMYERVCNVMYDRTRISPPQKRIKVG